ncbi:MAG: PIN domain-containing protein [Nitrospirae bacterium]|nr:PIN domain-containing protein [Nitrospirota bacterium]
MADARIKAILDTSILIPFINRGIAHPVLDIDIGKPLLHLSAVVAAELYAGAFDGHTIKLLDKLYKTFHDVNRIIIPSSSDWQTAGKVIAKLGGKHGYEDKFLSKIQNDILIALSARQIGAFVVTNNTKDFLRIKEFVNFNLLT